VDLLVEMTLTGPALSLQTKNRAALRAWRRDVRAAGLANRVRKAAASEDVYISVGDFRWFGNLRDSDNIIKPAQDALIAVLYDDDRQVRDALGFTRRNVSFVPITLGTLPLLRAGLASGSEFVHVAVSAATDPHFSGVVDA
jgi:crossover junction endodeoxyribonuclease RusA